MKNKFSLKNRIHSFKYAFDGFKTLIKEEHNARIHLIITIAVIISGFIFTISPTEWISVLFAIALVFSMEAINTAIEKLSDIVSPEIHPQIKKIKDLSAFAVLICAVISIIIGIMVFLPHIMNIFIVD